MTELVFFLMNCGRGSQVWRKLLNALKSGKFHQVIAFFKGLIRKVKRLSSICHRFPHCTSSMFEYTHLKHLLSISLRKARFHHELKIASDKTGSSMASYMKKQLQQQFAQSMLSPVVGVVTTDRYCQYSCCPLSNCGSANLHARSVTPLCGSATSVDNLSRCHTRDRDEIKKRRITTGSASDGITSYVCIVLLNLTG
eukprot:GHVN01101425.1.p1 GENE.GHVN01101425.1~~GHVN01101425.1.p1  ORF type:complete len:197 (-),score=14.44 GHVN01101425.1:260-850(-)